MHFGSLWFGHANFTTTPIAAHLTSIDCACLYGCSTRPSNSLSDEVSEIDWTQWGIDTQIDHSELVAGTTLTVECSVQAPVDVEEASIPLKGGRNA